MENISGPNVDIANICFASYLFGSIHRVLSLKHANTAFREVPTTKCDQKYVQQTIVMKNFNKSKKVQKYLNDTFRSLYQWNIRQFKV